MARNSNANVINFGSNSLLTRGDLQKTRSSSSTKSSSSSNNNTSSKREPSGMEKAAAGKLFFDLQKFVSTYREVAEAQKAREQAMDAMVKIVNQYGDATDLPKLDQNLKNVAGRFGLDTEVMSDLIKALRDNNATTANKVEMSEGLKNYNNNVNEVIGAIRDGVFLNKDNTTGTKPEMSQGLKNTVNNTNTLISAIRDGIFSPRGINSMLAEQRRNQVMQILNGKNPTTPTTNTPATTEETSAEDVVEYTYKPGDTFGQVIKNLGLQTDNGLWGPNGDVAYYTRQLAEQGAMNSRGNIPIGTTIRLVRRK